MGGPRFYVNFKEGIKNHSFQGGEETRDNFSA
jgi:hypothetical protein